MSLGAADLDQGTDQQQESPVFGISGSPSGGRPSRLADFARYAGSCVNNDGYVLLRIACRYTPQAPSEARPTEVTAIPSP